MYFEFIRVNDDTTVTPHSWFHLYDQDFQPIRSYQRLNTTFFRQHQIRHRNPPATIGERRENGVFELCTYIASDSSLQFDTTGLTVSFLSSILFQEQTNKYLACHYGGLAIADSNFHVERYIYPPDAHVTTYGRIELFKDGAIVLGARRPGENTIWQITFNSYDKDLNLLTEDTYGDESIEDYPFLYDAIDQTSNAIFTGGMYDIWLDLHWRSDPNELVVSKYDHDLNLLWRTSYGGDAVYIMSGVRATTDGGCVAYGSRRDPEDGIRYPFMLKIDSDGVITNSQDIQTPTGEHQFTLYGNPVKSTLNLYAVFNPVYDFSIALFSIDGRALFTRQLSNGMNEISVGHLASGAYVYSIVNKAQGQIVDSHIVMISR